MKHIDLFSGIGGFAYAADQVWNNVDHVFCDTDPFCQQVIRKHWPDSYIFTDIGHIKNKGQIQYAITDTKNTHGRGGQFSKEQTAVRPQRNNELSGSDRIDLLTGGFPCQPFSAAGVRRGTSDERYLWPEMLRVIRLSEPQWVIAENVGGLLTMQDGLVFEQVCTDLEAAGYEVQPFVIPAVAVNAPHRRDRVWFIGHAKHNGQYGAENPQGDIKGTDGNKTGQDKLRQPKGTDSLRANVKDAPSQRLEGESRSEQGQSVSSRPDWERDWHEVATQFCSVDDGLPVELDGFKLSKPRHRKEQLKAYGNAIVPQIAIELMEGMKL
jgi:DNA (cytosine-5)-methyltransferase 1